MMTSRTASSSGDGAGADGLRSFRPHPWTVGAHRQTLLAYCRRGFLKWGLAAEDVWVEAAPDVRLLLRVTWQAGPRAARPLLLVVHGLGGSDRAAYTVSTGRLAFARGWHVARMNMRGVGDSEAASTGFCNAGLDLDVVAVLQALARLCPRLALVGFSLGASVSLLALGRRPGALPDSLLAAAGVCPPLDLAACAAALERPGGRLYNAYFMRKLRAAYRQRQRRHPQLYEAGRERRARTVRDFDEAITAPYGGYRSAADYYERSSAGPWLVNVERPTLVLAARDDPMVPSESVARWPLPASGVLERELLATGGHVGFLAPAQAPGGFWAADCVLAFLERKLGLTPALGRPAARLEG